MRHLKALDASVSAPLQPSSGSVAISEAPPLSASQALPLLKLSSERSFLGVKTLKANTGFGGLWEAGKR